jgi:molybdate transport system substrate-binding protein
MPQLRHRFRRRLAAALLGLACVAAGSASRAESQVTLFAAASTTDAVQAVLARFAAAHPNVEARASFAASSTLAKQIARGAPADLYLSANRAWTDYLADRGAIRPDSRVDLLGNRLVAIVPAGSPPLDRLADLPDRLGDRRLAMGDPAHVPAGQYAAAALRHLGLWDRLRRRAAFAGNVRSALALVARGEAPAGLVYATDARISDRVQAALVLPADSHPPIRYPLARVAGADGPGVAALHRYLRGAEAAEVFRDHGFSVLWPAAGASG